MPRPDVKGKENELIFALDIGTRSIIGIVGIQQGETFHLLDMESVEHRKRAMIDGQIEDIHEVARVAGLVRERLQERLGVTLQQVEVAAAGRALKTRRASFEMELNNREPISNETVQELEIGAISKACEEMNATADPSHSAFYCVGHSVMQYFLDDYPISTLIGHRGNLARTTLIATFLPNEVVESLYGAMAGAGLQITGLTLEPIAAMNAIVPKELRRLNLALVDIGAGTSDIAISDEGSVVAYNMATVAGDEVTEAVIQHYLVDFETAEQMKLSLSEPGDTTEYTDILGFHYTINKQELLQVLEGAIDTLCDEIVDKILEANNRPPAAVFLVGGGSKLPTLCQRVAALLGLEPNKVAVGGNNYMKRMVVAKHEIADPQFATPFGIAITAGLSQGRDGLFVYLNKQKTRLFRAHNITVMDALLFGGFQHSQIIGRSGKSLTVLLNGQKKVVRGGYPTHAQLTVNGKLAHISSPIQAGDSIEITPAVSGSDAAPTLEECFGGYIEPFTITLNGRSVQAGGRLLRNGQPALPGQLAANGDVVEYTCIDTLGALCGQAGIPAEEAELVCNGQPAQPGLQLCPGDVVHCTRRAPQPVLVGGPDAAQAVAHPQPATAQPQPQTQPQPQPEPQPLPDEPYAPGMQIRLNGQAVELAPKFDSMPYLFVDMLNFVDIDPANPQGDIVLRLNGKNASYLDTIAPGDSIEIYWSEE